MKLFVANIPEEGQTIQLSSKVDWVCNLVRHALPKENSVLESISGKLHLLRVNQYLHIEGFMAFDLMAHCDRCLKEFSYPFRTDFKLDLSPLHHSKHKRDRKQDEEIELTTEDMEFSFYDGEEIDLTPIVREELILSLPNHFLCVSTCKGLCQRCGVDLNRKKCVCRGQKAIDPRWEVLKKISGKSR